MRGPPLRPLADAPVPWVALRAAEIYGFGRGLVDRIRAGTYRVIDDGTSRVSRIHVVDLVAAILAPASSPVTGAINVDDDDPAPLGEVADAVAARLGLPPQPRVPTAAVPAEVAGMLTADRRIANRRLRDEFDVALRYPNWRDGLEADGGRGARSPASAPGRQAATTSADLAEFHEHGVDSSLGSRRTSGRRARLDRARNIAQTATIAAVRPACCDSPVHLQSLTLTDFRSCASTRVRFDETLTVLAGENNAGKTNVLDALRLVTAPSEARRSRYLTAEDVRIDAAQLRLEVEFAGLDPAQRGLFVSALRSNGASEALWQMSWAPPTGVARRRSPTWTVGPRSDPDGDAEVRDLIRHVHLHALRDADRDLASSSPGRIEFLLRQLLLGKEAERDALLASARTASATVLKERPLVDAQDRILRVFSPLSAGFHPHEVHLRFADPTLIGLARDLRLSLAQQGVDPTKLAQTGLGYSNLLYLASVLVELGAARDAELTLLLVEEPESHLHPQLQRATLAFLQRQAAESARPSKPGEYAGRVQVIVTTHSPNLTAATSVRRIVVLRAGVPLPDAPTTNVPDTASAESPWIDPAAAPTPPLNVAIEAKPVKTGSVAPAPGLGATVSTETIAIAISELGLESANERKIDRYLDVTKATLLFGRRVLLLEGMAEALLFPVFAACVLDDDEMARFRAAAVIAIESVDFEPYIRLLLTRPTKSRFAIADRVVVVTDEDVPKEEEADDDDAADRDKEESADGAAPVAPTMAAGRLRKMHLEALAESLGARAHLHVEVTPQTLEASLISDALTGAATSPY